MTKLLHAIEDLESAAVTERVTRSDITSVQDAIGRTFVGRWKENISSRFAFLKDVITSISIYYPKASKPGSYELPLYGDDSVEALIDLYAKDLPAETVNTVVFVKEAIISTYLRTEWITYCSQGYDHTSQT